MCELLTGVHCHVPNVQAVRLSSWDVQMKAAGMQLQNRSEHSVGTL